jgi:hypothetical protein
MSLINVWVRTLGDGLVRADQIVGVHARRTPAMTGKPSHWLLNAVLPLTTGGGQLDTWATSPLHRTLIQTSHEPFDAPEHLVRLLAQLDAVTAAGIVTATVSDLEPSAPAASAATTANEIHSRGDRPTPAPAPAPMARTTVRFQFSPFRGTNPGHHYDPDYL